MYFAVVLANKENTCLAIPASYCEILEPWNAYNYGINRNKPIKIFYSPNLLCDPNFLLPLESNFSMLVVACYTARFKRAFPDFESCQNYVQKKRNYVEPVYNPKRLLEPTHMELERKVSEEYAKDSKVEVQKAVQLLREAVLVKKQPSIDLTESDVEEYQEALNNQMVNLSIDEEIEAELLMHNELYAALVKGEPLNAENSVINLPDVSVSKLFRM